MTCIYFSVGTDACAVAHMVGQKTTVAVSSFIRSSHHMSPRDQTQVFKAGQQQAPLPDEPFC